MRRCFTTSRRVGWVAYKADPYNADLENADLENASLVGADLRNADLCYADLLPLWSHNQVWVN